MSTRLFILNIYVFLPLPLYFIFFHIRLKIVFHCVVDIKIDQIFGIYLKKISILCSIMVFWRLTL
jgi:hypothetical protein